MSIGTRLLIDSFDANCYITLTHKLDSHDVSRNRGKYHDILKSIVQPTLIIGILSDGLYPVSEQQELANHIPNSQFFILPSQEGHDAFLIEMEGVSDLIRPFIIAHERSQIHDMSIPDTDTVSISSTSTTPFESDTGEGFSDEEISLSPAKNFGVKSSPDMIF